MTENPERRTRDDWLNIDAHPAAAGHAGPKNFIVEIDVDDLGRFGFETFDCRMRDCRLGAPSANPSCQNIAFGIEDGLGASAR